MCYTIDVRRVNTVTMRVCGVSQARLFMVLLIDGNIKKDDSNPPKRKNYLNGLKKTEKMKFDSKKSSRNTALFFVGFY